MKKYSVRDAFSGKFTWEALRIALWYLVIGGVWIIISDNIAQVYVADRAVLARISLIKGWGFVFITALLLYVLVRREMLAVRDTESRYRLLAENTADVIWIIDIETHRFEYISPSVVRLTGYTVEEVLQKDLAQMVMLASLKTIQQELPKRITAFEAGDSQAAIQTYEVELSRRDGSTVWIEAVTTLLNTGTGKVKVFGVSRDISKRRRAEETLRGNEELLRLAYEAADLGTLRIDKIANQVALDERSCRHYGIDDRLVTLQDFLARVHPDDLNRLLLEVDTAAAPGSDGRFQIEYRVMHPNSGVHWLHIQTRVYFEGEGPSQRPVLSVSTTQDITKRKHAEAEQRLMEERMRLSIRTANIGFYDWDITTTKVAYSSEWKRQIGYEDDEISNEFSEWETRLHPDDLIQASRQYERTLYPPYPNFQAEFRLRHKDGTYRSILASGSMMFDQTGMPERMVGTHLDITEQKQIEARLRRSEAALTEAQRVAHLGSWELHLATNHLEWSDEMYNIFGISKQHFSGDLMEVFTRAIHPDDRAVVEASNQAMIHEGQPMPVEYCVVWPDGTVRMVWGEAGKLILDKEGRPEVLTGIVQDITELKLAEQALESALFRLRRYVDSNLIGIVITEKTGTVIEANDYYLNLLGFTREDLDARRVNWKSCTPEAFQAADDLAFAELLANGTSTPYEKQYVRKDGSRVWVLVSDAVLDQERNEIAAFVFEISERKQAEAELQRVMEELRRSNAELEQFAYIASHDLQEPLRTIAGMVQLLQQRYKDQLDERGEEYIQHTVQGTQRMQALINDLLLFSRVNRRGVVFRRVACSDVLEGVLNNLAIAVRDSGAVITYDPEFPELFADASQLVQVFQNLIGNAIKFRGEQTPEIHVGVQRTAEYWQFSVSDNGIGIDAKYFERIFAPFQRLHTRREYQGNGIGLAICKKIIDGHAGRIWVESTPGQGSTFFFTLPIEQKLPDA